MAGDITTATSGGSPRDLARAPRPYEKRGLDDLIYEYSTERTLAQALEQRVTSRNARTYFIANLLCSAVFDLDVGLISEIAKRLDGQAPAAGEVDMYSSTFADAIEGVLAARDMASVTVYPEDLVVTALAKALFVVANKDPGKNPTARKDRARAVSMILDRVEGRREASKAAENVVEYMEPRWMSLLEPSAKTQGSS